MLFEVLVKRSLSAIEAFNYAKSFLFNWLYHSDEMFSVEGGHAFSTLQIKVSSVQMFAENIVDRMKLCFILESCMIESVNNEMK